MTRAEQISEYANSFNGKGMESEELKEIIRLAIIDGAKWADNHPIKPSLPYNLDEAANNYGVDIRLGYPRVMDETDKYIYNAFKAGAKWMAGQGDSIATRLVIHNRKVNLNFAIGDITDENCKPKYRAGQDVIVQIRKITR